MAPWVETNCGSLIYPAEPSRPLECEAPGRHQSALRDWTLQASVPSDATAMILGDGMTGFRGQQLLTIGQLQAIAAQEI